MGTAAGMVAEMKKLVGTTEHPPGSNRNFITAWYPMNGEPWCDMTVSYSAAHSDNAKVVGKFAYTPSHANWFASKGQWHAGTTANVNKAQPGDIVFFDWGHTNTRANIDHVGVVVRSLGGGKVLTIEGNSSDRCGYHTRSSLEIAGFGRPAYTKPKPKPWMWNGKAPSGSTVLKLGTTGTAVKSLQSALNKAMVSKLSVDGEMGAKTVAALKSMQKKAKITSDGQYGSKSAAALTKLLSAK